MDERSDGPQNMVSNLPLLFVNSYPTSLMKITEEQLEKFIPFMVQCSLGLINTQKTVSEPEWWPDDVPFQIPPKKPDNFTGSWHEKLKEIVNICYQFHKSMFLLKFCNDLALYDPVVLRFRHNHDNTTSLYVRRRNKLLVTFRNENLTYDQPQRNRKCLLQQRSKNQSNDANQYMVEPPLFDIYLCDNCDAELYTLEAWTDHEKVCVDNDDVIICESPTLDNSQQHTDNISKENESNGELEKFLLNFNLRSRHIPSSTAQQRQSPTEKIKSPKNNMTNNKLVRTNEKTKRLARRNRGFGALTKYLHMPLSEPGFERIIKKFESALTDDYFTERVERIERFCYAPPMSNALARQRFLDKKVGMTAVPCTFRKPSKYSLHHYVYPHRHFRIRNRISNFLFLNSMLLKQCRPFSVRLKKLTENDILRKRRSVSSVESTPNGIYVPRRPFTVSSNKKFKAASAAPSVMSRPNKEVIVDCIDLCSSDDDDEVRIHNANKLNDLYIGNSNNGNINTISNISIAGTSTANGKFRLNNGSNGSVSSTVIRVPGNNSNGNVGSRPDSVNYRPAIENGCNGPRQSMINMSNPTIKSRYPTNIENMQISMNSSYINNNPNIGDSTPNSSVLNLMRLPLYRRPPSLKRIQDLPSHIRNNTGICNDLRSNTLQPNNKLNTIDLDNRSTLNNQRAVQNQENLPFERGNNTNSSPRLPQLFSYLENEVTISRITSPNRVMTIDMSL